MGSIVIRNIPDDVLKRFRERARSEGKSAEQLGREALTEKAKLSREQIIKEIDAIRSLSKPIDLETTLRIMREARDERDARPFASGHEDDR